MGKSGEPGDGAVWELCCGGGVVLDVAERVGADLTVVGPEAPLVNGVVDQFRAAGRLIVGPLAENARLEGSKIYSKDFFGGMGFLRRSLFLWIHKRTQRRRRAAFDFLLW